MSCLFRVFIDKSTNVPFSQYSLQRWNLHLETARFHHDFIGQIFFLDLFNLINSIARHWLNINPVINKRLFVFFILQRLAIKFEVHMALFGNIHYLTLIRIILDYDSMKTSFMKARHSEY